MAGKSDAERGADKAFEGKHDTQPASKSEQGAEYVRNEAAENAGQSVTQNRPRGMEGEAGREEEQAVEREAGRVSAPSTARLSTGVNPSDPIDDDSPNLPTP